MGLMKIICLTLLFFLVSINSNADMYQTMSDEGCVLYSNVPASGSKMILKEKEPLRKGLSKAIKKKNYSGHEYGSIAEEKAKRHNVDPKLVAAVIRAESNWNPKAVSQKGAVGMMQLMPKTANDLGVGDPYNAEENIDGGVRYLRYLIDKFNGNLTLALAAYNAGPAKVEKVGGVPSIPETINYVNRVMHDYSGGTGWISAGSPVTKIRMVVQSDGSVLFTNAYNSGRSYRSN